VWLTRLTAPLLTIAGRSLSARDLVLLGGGLFLLTKSVLEIHKTLERPPAEQSGARLRSTLVAVVLQIAVIDIVFSLDSVFTAVGLVRELPIMVAAIVVAILVMMWVSRSIGAFITRHPTIKVLGFAFLLLIGVALVGEGLHFEIPKGYLYFAMAFAFAVELINMRVRR
jgi:predicted tellurium resistance membrane protein TerC